ncbi:ABC transporter ATP-binding protein [Streptosporangium sp. NBC_01756]|uniref:ABC transporter ATP-binding protein n=1 Tax=Streptosporangium sp. NBC_01756 TaxID=2975950 RepID=UPI002DD9A5BE|nr:ABC transporter ATP-binding protein [Streptosporangium sp. NBC_01756]WSC83914.1 ABC transporter ATP-binding protein [Streptosporangium sp. NBC_01756]
MNALQSSSRQQPPPAVRLAQVSHVYGARETAVTALKDITWDFTPGTFTAVMGPSGSGKTTFLQCAAGLLEPTSGSVFLGSNRLNGMTEKKLAILRRDLIGFVFQAFNLIPALTAAENITLPLRLARRGVDQAWTNELAKRAGIANRLGHRPHELSGGQQQRVAICRALITRPQVLCADEPTGALDKTASRAVLSVLREAVNDLGQTVIMVTHDPVAAAIADHVLFLVDGRITDMMDAPDPERVAATVTRLAGED